MHRGHGMGYNLEITFEKWITAAAVSILEWRISNKNPVYPVGCEKVTRSLKAETWNREDVQLRFDTG